MNKNVLLCFVSLACVCVCVCVYVYYISYYDNMVEGIDLFIWS